MIILLRQGQQQRKLEPTLWPWFSLPPPFFYFYIFWPKNEGNPTEGQGGGADICSLGGLGPAPFQVCGIVPANRVLPIRRQASQKVERRDFLGHRIVPLKRFSSLLFLPLTLWLSFIGLCAFHCPVLPPWPNRLAEFNPLTLC